MAGMDNPYVAIDAAYSAAIDAAAATKGKGYAGALAKAEADRQAAKVAAQADYAAYLASVATTSAADDAARAALAAKLKAGTATPAELQQAVYLALNR